MLENTKILIDGYNLRLKTGTGIKNYGFSLVNAIHALNAEISVLFDKKISTRKNKVLREAFFFEGQETDNNMNYAYLLIKNLLLKNFATYIPKETVILDNKSNIEKIFWDHINIYNADKCYEISNFIYKKIKLITDIEIPQKIDIWHCTYPLPIKISKAKKITTIHDLIPLRLPYTTQDDKYFFYNLIQHSIEESDLIITVSENTKKDIVDVYNCNPEKIFVTYQPVNIRPLSREISDKGYLSRFLEKYQLKENNYLLFVGAIEPKKNLARLLEAYYLANVDIPLVVVGKKAWLWENELENIEKLFGRKFSKKVKLLDYVPYFELSLLYKGASCFMFPSLYEGFGLPPLEAMSVGCPVITSNVSSLPEVCGKAALYCDPYDTFDIGQKIKEVLSNNSLRESMKTVGYEQVKKYSFDNYINKVNEAYNKVLE